MGERRLPSRGLLVHHSRMTPIQRLPASLTPLDTARSALLDGLEPVAPIALRLAEALGCVAAKMPALKAMPSADVAAADGFALRARDIAGASSYSPLPLIKPPVFVEVGEPMPEGCDCVLAADAIDQTGPLTEVLTDAIPGQGVRRMGGDIAEGSSVMAPGRRIRPLDLLVARAAGFERINVRRPRLRLLDVPASSGHTMTAQLIPEVAGAAGAEVVVTAAAARDARSIAAMIDASACDVLVTTGGSGTGRADAVISALAARGAVMAHGIALQPGRTAAAGRIGRTPVIALPGAPDQALAAWWALVLPVLDRLCGLEPRQRVTLPLARKIASHVGIAEIVLLERNAGAWMPLAVGELSLEAIARSDAWLLVPSEAEGFAAGAPVDAYLLRDW